MRTPTRWWIGLLLVLSADLARASRPDNLIAVESAGRTRVVLIAEKSTQQLHLWRFRDGIGRPWRTIPCTTGKVRGDKRVEGDLKTPEGVYDFVRAYSGESLPPLYGAGALVMDYPNHFDLLAGKTGSGIWLHGVETEERVHVARDTRGCVAIGNRDFASIRPSLRLHDTPIVVVEQLRIAEDEELARDESEIRAFVEDWRSAWESKDIESYMRFYDASFRSEGRSRAEWARHKRDIAAREGTLRIGLDHLTILREKDRLHVTFRQEYAAHGHRDVGMKSLLLRARSTGGFVVVGEEFRPMPTRFELIEPDDIVAPLTPAVLADIAPDAAAAPAAAPPEAQPPRATAPDKPPDATVVAPTEQPVPPTLEAPRVEPVAEAEPVAPIIEAPQPPRAAVTVVPSTPPAQWSAVMSPPRVERGTLQLLGPHARRDREQVLLQVQLLNSNASQVRKGTIVLTLPDGPRPPERYAIKQGQLLAVRLAIEAKALVVGVMVRDDEGRIVLDQDIVVEPLPASGRAPGMR